MDAHCHLADHKLDEGLEVWLKEASALGITYFIQGGVGPEDWNIQLEISRKYPGRIFPCFGVHPWFVAKNPRESCLAAFEELKTKIKDSVGVGELGLDFSKKIAESSYDLQRELFKMQLRFAREKNLPLVLHIVHAHSEALAILREIGVPEAGGIVHSFSGDASQAKHYTGLGLSLSLGGSVLSRLEKLKQIMVATSLDQIVVETDAPDQTPQDPVVSPQGERPAINPPLTLIRVAEEVSKIKGVDFTNVLEQSKCNLIKIFGLSI